MRSTGLWGALFGCAVAGCGSNLPAYGGGGAGGSGRGGVAGDVAGTGGTAVVMPSDFTWSYTWGAVTVRVEPTSAAASGLTLQVTDQATSPTASGTLQFPPATTLGPTTDGAFVVARHSCSAHGLYQVEIHSCAGDYADPAPALPDCVAVAFRSDGTIIGGFKHSSGVQCTIREGSASMRVPPPDLTAVTPGEPPPDAATGTFKLDCQGSDGAILHILHFEGTFALPVASRVLLC